MLPCSVGVRLEVAIPLGSTQSLALHCMKVGTLLLVLCGFDEGCCSHLYQLPLASYPLGHVFKNCLGLLLCWQQPMGCVGSYEPHAAGRLSIVIVAHALRQGKQFAWLQLRYVIKVGLRAWFSC
jgi:hypothetical protein